MIDLLIEGGTVITPNRTVDAAVAVADETIVGVGKPSDLPSAKDHVDATGLLVMPGVVDPHVHVDEVPSNRAGTYSAETAAAAAGGVTTFIDFAWQERDRAGTEENASLMEGIAHKQEKGTDARVDYSLHGVLSLQTEKTLAEIPSAIDAGVTSFKMFKSNYRVGVNNGFLLRAFEHIAQAGGVAALHTEDPDVCNARATQLKQEEKAHPRHFPDSRPDYAEAMAIDNALRLAAETGVKYYGVHNSSRKATDAIKRYQTKGTDVRAEVCTHHLALDRSAFETKGNRPVLAPPLRESDDRNALFDRLIDGTINVVSTDHAVYHEDAKEVDAWWDAPLGVNSLQTSLPVFHDIAIQRRGLSYPFLVRKLCTNPASIFGLSEKGTLEPGTDADIILFDPEASQTLRDENILSGAGYTVYDGREVKGRVVRTYVRGQLVAKDGEVTAKPGHGQFIPRDLPSWSA